jgi:hypothetical protein
LVSLDKSNHEYERVIKEYIQHVGLKVQLNWMALAEPATRFLLCETRVGQELEETQEGLHTRDVELAGCPHSSVKPPERVPL